MQSIPKKQAFYIFSNGLLKHKENTIFFVPAENQTDETIENAPPPIEMDDEEIPLELDTEEIQNHPNHKAIPIAKINAFYVFAEVTFNTRFMNFLSEHNIPMYLFDYYGFYSGTNYPHEYSLSGNLFVHQVQHYTAEKKRLAIAREFYKATLFNIQKNLRHYAAESRQPDKGTQSELQRLNGKLTSISAYELPNSGAQANWQQLIKLIDDFVKPTFIDGYGKPIPYVVLLRILRATTVTVRKSYDELWSLLLKPIEASFEFKARRKHPSNNAFNALILFGDALCYTACLTELYRTQLNPTIAYLREPSDRQFSLAIDMAEIFKPIFVDRVIFKLVNTQQIQEKHFTKKGVNFCYLNDAGRKIFVKEFEETLRTTIEHPKLERSVSYRQLIGLDCDKLVNHLLGKDTYEAFKIWW
jgi:CRISPR-associated protein Cas1